MLTTDITALADRLAPHQQDGVVLQPLAVQLVVSTLRDLAERARAIEGRPVPPHLRGDLPPDVLRFPGRAA